ncbi:hypothetical protein HYQ45_015767 [Verticillium longisporum]|uniref:Uncharacterized protein n=1 Tax=Verticillium longisporum TaxID=100787 RepID=A0A8I2Z841_VERLO|nr:hypothetical protein HYQ45_015767 [Verticillium longisporum]
MGNFLVSHALGLESELLPAPSSSTLDPRIPPPNIFLSIPIVETFVPRAPLPPSGSTTPLHHATRVKLSRAVVRIKLGRSLFDHQNIPIIQRDN